MEIENQLRTFTMLFSNRDFAEPQDEVLSYKIIITTYPGSITIQNRHGEIKSISEQQFFELLNSFFMADYNNKKQDLKSSVQLHYAEEYEILIQEVGEKDKRRNVTCLLRPGEEFTISIQPPENDNK